MNPPRDIAAAFALAGEVTDIQPIGGGLINDTWLVITTGEAGRVILQRINSNAFPRPDWIIDNLQALLDHVRQRQRREQDREWDLRFPRLYPSRDGSPSFTDGEGRVWRALSFIERSRGIDRLADPAQARETGRGLGRFHALTADLDPAGLHQSRPDFHDTPRYLERLRYSAEQASHRRDAPPVRAYLEFVEQRAADIDAIQSAAASGLIRPQPVHGDPKLDNFLFDVGSGRVASLIDLDTFQSGIVHHDIADCLRSCCNSAGESPQGGSAVVRYDAEICRAVLGGYFEEVGDAAADLDTDHLIAAIRLIPLELGMRFLTDFLNGNCYFRTDYPEQNLHRANIQFQLVEDIERRWPALREIVDSRGR